MKQKDFIVSPGKRLRLKDRDPGFTAHFKNEEAARSSTEQSFETLAKHQDMLLAEESHALLIIVQAMDGSAKDGTIKSVMSNVDPQGCEAHNFKEPSDEELGHDYLWRFVKHLPERGHITIFNRSYYEEVLVTRVHPEGLKKQQLPAEAKGKNIWKRRFDEINNFEQYLVNNGTLVLKFFLHISKEGQRKRLLERIELPEKKWKFSVSDIEERGYWDDYMKAYEDALNHTSTKHAPWYIIPAEHRWLASAGVAEVVVSTLKSLKLRYPMMSKEQRGEMMKAKEQLESE
ncbi:MAG: polyphosphate kinase 2 family protein [Pyrinomonadaceae bacterium]|nr:polyphosphate kinase 2 family protein [Pyrinomonadaceae bacterium]